MNTFKCLFVGNKEKGRILKRVFQENKACQIFRKTNSSYPLICTRTYEYQGIRNVCISEKLGVLCVLETPVLRFALFPNYRRIVVFDNSYFPSLSEVDKSNKTKKK